MAKKKKVEDFVESAMDSFEEGYESEPEVKAETQGEQEAAVSEPEQAEAAPAETEVEEAPAEETAKEETAETEQPEQSQEPDIDSIVAEKEEELLNELGRATHYIRAITKACIHVASNEWVMDKYEVVDKILYDEFSKHEDIMKAARERVLKMEKRRLMIEGLDGEKK